MTKFFRQENDGTCGLAAVRNVLYNVFGTPCLEEKMRRMVLSHEHACDIKEGLGPASLACIAKQYGLKAFTRKNGSVGELVYFLEKGLWPIIHRLSDDSSPDGHYLVVHKHGFNPHRRIYIFDPDGVDGGIRVELADMFDKKWNYPPKSLRPEKWYMILCPEEVKIPFKGRYL